MRERGTSRLAYTAPPAETQVRGADDGLNGTGFRRRKASTTKMVAAPPTTTVYKTQPTKVTNLPNSNERKNIYYICNYTCHSMFLILVSLFYF